MLPRQYASSTSPEEIVAHLNLLSTLGRSAFNVRVVERNTHIEITVVADDNDSLLSRIAGTVTHLGFSILSARIFTRVDGKAIDKFWVAVPEGPRLAASTLEDRLIGDLEENFKFSREELHELRARFKPRSALGAVGRVRELPMKATVAFSNEVSDNFSTVDITCSDKLGLLFQVTKVFSDLKLNVHGAILTTEADKAMDSFYVTDAENRKLASAELIDLTVTTLINELSES
jgi:[protein-PII] uridylyltransferase